MDFNLREWLNLAVRWTHVFAGILWIGQTYFFTWLDGQLSAGEAAAEHGAPVLMVHSGGFYVVRKQKVPELLPQKLQWFRWEAMITWLSGIALLIIVYYTGGVMVDDSVRNISVGRAVAVGVGILLASWVVYDLLSQSAVGKSEGLFASVSFLLIVLITYGLTHVLSGRAAYIHIGAILGTIMAANVWMRILPAQRHMIAALKEGKPPDPALAARAKL